MRLFRDFAFYLLCCAAATLIAVCFASLWRQFIIEIRHPETIQREAPGNRFKTR